MKYLVNELPAFTREIGLVPLSEEFLVNSMWGNILLAEDGWVYAGGGNHATIGGEVWLFRYNSETGKSEVCSSLSDVLGVRAATTAVGESKIHTRICEGKDGKVYFGTMQGGIGHLSKLPHYWHPDQYEGGHLFEYDPETEVTRDLGIPIRGEGLQTMVMDRERNVLYLVTWPKKTFLKHDLNTHETSVYGVFGWSPTSEDKVKIHLGRELILTAEGRVYATNNFGCLVRYDPDTDALEDTDIKVRENDSLRIHVRTKAGIIYFATSLGYLFRMDPKTEEIEPLGQVTPYDSVYTPNMALSNDETKLYYLAGSHGSYVGGGLMCVEFDIEKRTHKVFGVLDPRFFLSYCYGVCVDEKDRVIFAVHGGDPPSSYLAIHDPAHPEQSKWLVTEEEARNAPPRSIYAGPGSEGNTRGWIVTDYHLLTRPTGESIPNDQSAVTSLITGSDGAIYGATSAIAGRSAHLFRLNHPKEDVQVLAHLGESLATSQKVTKSLVYAVDGNIYGGTQDIQEDLYIEKRYSSNYPPRLPEGSAGGHLFKYDTEKGKVEDLGIPAPGQAIYAMCASPDGSKVYALTFPHATLLSLDVASGRITSEAQVYGPDTWALRPDEFEFATKSFVFGRLELEARAKYLIEKRGLSLAVGDFPQEAFSKKYHVSRAIVCDDQGNVYGSHGEGKIWRFTPETKQLDILECEFPIMIGTEYGLISDNSIESLIRADDGMIYGGTCQDGYLFQFDSQKEKVKGLGKPVIQGRIRDLAFWRNTLYGIVGENLGKTHLFSYAPDGAGLRDLGVLQAGGRMGFAVNICDTLAAGPDDRLYIGQSERISTLLSLSDIEYQPYQSP
jgi:hypothetical protein